MSRIQRCGRLVEKKLYVSAGPLVYICVGLPCNFYFEKYSLQILNLETVSYSPNSTKIRARHGCSEKLLESCSQLSVMYGLRSKIRDQRDKRDSRDLRDPAKNPGPGPGRKIKKIRDSGPGLKIEKSWIGTGTQISGFRDSTLGTVPGTEKFPGLPV